MIRYERYPYTRSLLGISLQEILVYTRYENNISRKIVPLSPPLSASPNFFLENLEKKWGIKKFIKKVEKKVGVKKNGVKRKSR